MPVLPWDDLDVFFGDFACPVTLTLANGAVRVIQGIFDDPYLNTELGEYEADTSRPRLTVKEADVAGVKRGDTALVGAVLYDVLSSPNQDGNGTATLELALPGGAF